MDTAVQDPNRIFTPMHRSRIYRGYDPITLTVPEGWEIGYLKEQDPRPYQWFNLRTAPVIIMGMILITMGIGGLGFALATAATVWWLPLCGIFAATIAAATILLLWKVTSSNDQALEHAHLPQKTVFLKQPLPMHVRSIVSEAQRNGAFDSIRVLAPKVLFRSVTWIDPLIFGEKGGQKYFIAKFSFAEDLQEVYETP